MNLIVSVSSDWAIGYQNDLLFHVSEDMKYFKSKTIGKTVVMGQNTFLSLPGQKPLSDRINIVLSDDPNFAPQGVTVVRSLDELFEMLKPFDTDDVFVIGGAMIYETLLPYCTNAYITQFHASKPADRFFPCLEKSEKWRLAERSELHETPKGLTFTFDRYEQVTA